MKQINYFKSIYIFILIASFVLFLIMRSELASLSKNKDVFLKDKKFANILTKHPELQNYRMVGLFWVFYKIDDKDIVKKFTNLELSDDYVGEYLVAIGKPIVGTYIVDDITYIVYNIDKDKILYINNSPNRGKIEVVDNTGKNYIFVNR